MHRKISFTKKSKCKTDKEVRYFIYDGQSEIGSFDEQGQLKELRILGPTPHAEIGATLAIELNDKAYVSISDVCGNIAALLPLEGGFLEFTRYSAFGEELGSKISPWRFASKRIEETGLVNFGRRYYIPSLGRWLTPDPLGFHDGMNLYAYVHNNPLTHFDEYGLLDFGQYEKGWGENSERSRKAVVHEVGTQAVDLVNFVFSTPYYLECGINYATGRQNYRTQNWHQWQNHFFDSAHNWIYKTYPTDMTHPDYLRVRTGVAVANLVVGAYGLAKMGIQAARWGINAWRGYRLARQAEKLSSQSLKIASEWVLPENGGGAFINGRWYTEHALERMAPKNLEVMAKLETRALERAKAEGLQPGTEEFGDWWLINKPDPRGIPPSVVEAEITSPNSTNIQVILNSEEDVITVIPGGK